MCLGASQCQVIIPYYRSIKNKNFTHFFRQKYLNNNPSFIIQPSPPTSLTSISILLFFSKMGNCIGSMVSSREPIIFPMNEETINEPESKKGLNTLKMYGVVYHVPELTGKIERTKLVYVSKGI